MIREKLVAENIAVSVYKEIINYLSDRDPTTRRVIEKILAVEEEHTDDLYSFYHKYNLKEDHETIEALKQKAQDVGLELVAADENMTGQHDDNSGAKLSNIINKLNRVDTRHHYSSKDFIEKA